jgi:hypothetical protein
VVEEAQDVETALKKTPGVRSIMLSGAMALRRRAHRSFVDP